jgi:hypothetical protein
MKSHMAAAFLSLFISTFADAGIMLNSPATYTQDFDTLALSGSSSVTPADWEFAETGTAANINYTAGTGSGNVGDTYSFGLSGSPDRALGELTSGPLNSTFGVSFTNAGTTAIQSLTFNYSGEQWRIGNTGAARTDRLDFQYSLNATSLTAGTWINLDALDFLSPITTASSVGALNGNLAANRSNLDSTLTGLNINSGESIWIRWQAVDIGGSDDGLAIDNFSLTAQFAAVPEPSSIAFIIASGLCTAIYQKRRQPRERR